MPDITHARQSARMAAVQAPIIPIVGDLIRRTPGTISLGQGVAYYGPPESALARAREALADSRTHGYQAVDGLEPLRAALADKLHRENGIQPGPDRAVVVTAGGNMAFVNAVLAVADPGDEIVLPVPFYFNHEMAIDMAGCRVVRVPTTDAYLPRPETIRRALTPRTRAVVTVSPNNPSGAVYPEGTLREINALCREAGIYHVSDEVYEYFTYDDASHFSPGAIRDAAAHTISIFSFSKAYGFAGWRVGYMVVPAHLVTAVRKVQDTNLVCPPVISQMAALGALEAGPAYTRGKLRAIAEVRRTARGMLAEIADVCVTPPADGAFYLLMRVRTPLPPLTVVERLITEHRVAVTPGSAFGLTDGCTLRVSYGALQPETTTEGIGRLVRGLRALAT